MSVSRWRRWARSTLLVGAAFGGGAITAHLADATPSGASPYSTLDQLARVLVLVENQYVEPTQRGKLTEGAIKGIVAELDPHSSYMPPEEFAIFQGETSGKFGGVGVEVDFHDDNITVIAPIEGSPAARAHILPGDQILAIDGKPMRGERLDKLVGLMRGATGTEVTLLVHRKGVSDPIRFVLVREEIHVQSVAAKMLAGGIGYVRLKQFQEGTHKEIQKAAAALRAESRDLRGIILDMRNNPGGLVDEAEGVADEFLNTGVIYTTRHRGQIVDAPEAHAGGAFATMPIVALVNEYTASSAELVAGALQDQRRATIVGTQTFGKGSVQSIFELPGRAGMRLTTMRYYTPSGRSIQALGIAPDVVLRAPDGEPPGEVVRERDFDGHLPPEPGPPRPPPIVLTVKPSAPAYQIGEVPVDPPKGSDASLAAGYDVLMKAIVAPRAAAKG